MLDDGREQHRLGPADSVVLAAGEDYQLSSTSADLELLEVSLPDGNG